MKKCKKCGEIKSIDDFYVHHRMGDGHLNFCKSCVKERVSRYWYENAEVLREKEKERNKERSLDKEYMKRKAEKNKEFRTGIILRAHNQTQRKLSQERPELCQICGERKKIEAHHEDYLKPLEVVWCCTPCHRQIHLRKRKQSTQAV